MTTRILIIDDNEAWRRLVPELLKFRYIEDIDVQEADTAETGIEKFDEMVEKGQKPDLILMDARLPSLSGIDATRAILRRDNQIKIHSFTGYEDIDNTEKMIKVGARGIISKRSGVKKIIAQIVEALGE